jgi:hypothetical protein
MYTKREKAATGFNKKQEKLLRSKKQFKPAGKIKEHLRRPLQSESEEIRQAKEAIEQIIDSMLPDVMDEIFKEWHQLPKHQDSGAPTFSSHQAFDSTSTPQAQSRHDMSSSFVSLPSVSQSSSGSFSDLDPFRQLASSTSTTDSGYVSIDTVVHGQVHDHNQYCPPENKGQGMLNTFQGAFDPLLFQLAAERAESTYLLIGEENQGILNRHQDGLDPSLQIAAGGAESASGFIGDKNQEILNISQGSFNNSKCPQARQKILSLRLI